MKANEITAERLKQNIAAAGGGSVLFLRALKSDLGRVLRQYMAVEDLQLDVIEDAGGHKLLVSVRAAEFFEIGKGE